MAIAQRKMTLEEFLDLPEEEPALELEPDGTVIQKMAPRGRHSVLQYGICRLINGFAAPARLASAFPELRTVFGRAAYVPDVSVYQWARIPWTLEGKMPDDFNEPPDSAIEIVSPGQGVNSLIRRSLWYVENGVRIALVVDPEDQSVISFGAGQMPKALTGVDPIDLTSVLPGFELTVERLFAPLQGEIN